MMKLIGLGYKARTGKDTVAQQLVAAHGYKRYAFADELKWEVIQRLPLTLRAIARVYAGPVMSDEGLDDMIPTLVRNTKPPIIRELLQEYGSEVRRTDHPNYWVDRLGERLILEKPERVVITDMRFLNEVAFVKALGGIAVQVWRPDARAVNAHASETELDGFSDWDDVIINNTTLDELRVRTDALAASMEAR